MLRPVFLLFACLFAITSPSGAETLGDIDGDNKIGLEESIYSLQVVSGLLPEQKEEIVLNVKPVFKADFPGLGTIVEWIQEKIGPLSKDRVTIELDTTNVGNDQLLSSVSNGSLQAVHGYAGYHPIPAAALFGAIPFGPEVIEYLAWLYHGNGLTLWQQLYDDNGANVKILPCGAGTAESGGWFKTPVTSIADFSGLKMRSCGLAALMLEKVGAVTDCLSGGQIMSKFQDNSIDAAEFSTPAVDSALADFSTVADYNYFPGWHQPAIILELIINKDIWNNLTIHQQTAIDMTCRAATLENVTYSEAIQAQYIIDNNAKGVSSLYFADDILTTLKEKSTEVMAEQSLADTQFNTVWSDFSQFHATYSTWLDLGFYPRR